jgi:hypothetical protein
MAQGGCMCGAVRYECTADPAFMGNCHCRDCQRAAGGAYAPAIGVPRSAVKITGEVKYFESKTDSGNMSRRGFCPNCGSRLFSLPPFAPEQPGRSKYLQARNGYLHFECASLGPYESGVTEISQDAADGMRHEPLPATLWSD